MEKDESIFDQKYGIEIAQTAKETNESEAKNKTEITSINTAMFEKGNLR